jgi:hypothetical protein
MRGAGSYNRCATAMTSTERQPNRIPAGICIWIVIEELFKVDPMACRKVPRAERSVSEIDVVSMVFPIPEGRDCFKLGHSEGRLV